MTGWQDWMTSPAARALAWALVHFLWQGAAIVLLLAAALWLCRAARTRYLLACGAMAAMVLAFAVTMAVCWPAKLSPRGKAAGTPAAVRLAPLTDPGDGKIDAPRDSGPPGWFVPVWMGGVSLFYLYSLMAWLAATRLKARGTLAAPLEWQERLRQLAAGLGLRRSITLLESCLAEVPVVIGYFRPVILLPLGLLAGLATEQVEAILIHELAHIRRYDYLVNVMQTLVEGLLFYHPAVWWVGSLMRSEREHCCDDVVVARQGDARGYAATLARLELNRGTVREPVLAATGGNLMKRVHRLMQQPEGPRVAAPLVSATVLIATATLALSAWQSQPQPQVQPAPPQAAPAAADMLRPRPLTSRQLRAAQVKVRQDLQTPYIKWLNEDVAYIITDAERSTYKGLESDGEREQFIEQFWLRRDPTPGTIENEYKQEHYRRIAYANEKYASGIPGWKTDRGRIYITYGPPDEIDDHSSGGFYKRPPEEGGGETSTFPFQQWRYRHIDGIGNNVMIEFVDSTRTGEFHMTMDPAEKDGSPRTLTVTANVAPVSPGSGSHPVTFQVPLEGKAQRYHIAGQVTTLTGRAVAGFEEDVNGLNAFYIHQVALVPGSYHVTFTVKDLATGASSHGDTVVQVQ